MYKEQQGYVPYGNITPYLSKQFERGFLGSRFEIFIWKALAYKPAVVDDDQIKRLVNTNPAQMVRDIAEVLHTSYMIVLRNFKKNWILETLRLFVISRYIGKVLMDVTYS